MSYYYHLDEELVFLITCFLNDITFDACSVFSHHYHQVIDNILSMVKHLEDIHTDEDGPALVFNCQSGKGRTTSCMAMAGLFMWHKKVGL